MVRPWKDPYLTFKFDVEVDGIIIASFNEVSGLETEIEVVDYQEGGRNSFIHQLPGPPQAGSRLTLQRGLTDSQALWSWYREVHKAEGGLLDLAGTAVSSWTTGVLNQLISELSSILTSEKPGRKNVVIYLNDPKGEPLRWWVFQNVFPVKWSGPELQAEESAVAFEALELAHEGLIKQGTR